MKKSRKKKRAPPSHPCPRCERQTYCSVFYTDGTQTRRCGNRSCRALVRWSPAVVAAVAAPAVQAA